MLVANAGLTRDGLAVRMKDDDFAAVLDTNLAGAFRVARRATGPMMRARTGRLIFLSSVSGLSGSAGQVNYAASKAGLVGLARSFARELASRGVTANVVAPGPVSTDMTDALGLREAQRTRRPAAAVPSDGSATRTVRDRRRVVTLPRLRSEDGFPSPAPCSRSTADTSMGIS